MSKTYVATSNRTSIAVQEKNLTVFCKIFDLLKERGFAIQTDQRILKEFPVLADSHFEGEKDGLKFKAEYYPAGFKFEFFQDINFENPHGGFYDFEKLEKMPYLIRLTFMVTRKAICKLLELEGYTNTEKPHFKYAMDDVLYRIKDSCHYKKGQDLMGYTPAESYNNKDRDEKTLFNGQVKYFRGYDGRLRKGVIFHNINNMWWVILNKFEFTNIASFQLFDIKPGEKIPKRIQRKTMPERIRAKKVRERFYDSGLKYLDLSEEDITMLRFHLEDEFKHFDGEITFKLSIPKKKHVKVLKRTGLQYALLYVDGDYFKEREAISFNKDGFIGFAGWASGYNLTPFINAFEKWLDWKLEILKQVA